MTPGILARIFPIEDMKRTVMRFPLSVLCSFALFVICILTIHDVLKENSEIIGKVCMVLSCGYFFAGAAKLMEESGGLKQVVTMPVFAVLMALVAMSPQWALYLYFIAPALLLLIMVAPFSKDADNISFWFFNRMTWFGVAVAILASVIFGGGLSAALASINYLFGVDLPGEMYGYVWAFSCLIFGPIYALSWVPERFHFTREDCNDPPGLAFLLNWVLAPLVLLYLLILYAYLVKIMVTLEIPRGQLSYMIAGFGGVGVVTYLLGWPLKDEGGALLRFALRIFFPALMAPVAMQFYAIGERIGTYGITEQRAMIVICALWFAVIALAFTFRNASLRVIPASLAALMVLGLVAVNVSGHDQRARLDDLVAKYNLVQNGKIVKTTQEIPFKDRQNISSILDYLISTKRDRDIRDWMNETPKELDYFTGAFVVAEMGFDYVSAYAREDKEAQPYFNFYDSLVENGVQDIRGYDYIMTTMASMYNQDGATRSWPANKETSMPEITATVEDKKRLKVTVAGYAPIVFDIAAEIYNDVKHGAMQARQKLIMQSGEGKVRISLRITNLSGEYKNNEITLSSVNYQLMIGIE